MKRFFSTVSLLSFVAGMSLGAIGVSVRADMRGSGVFSDVRAGSYYDDAIGVMYAQGIITGYADGRFGPDDPLTRGQIAVIMHRFMEKVGGIESSSSTRSAQSTSASSEDDEVANEYGRLQFTVESFNVSESSPKASVSVVRNGGSKGTVRVDYATADGTATAGTDYTAMSDTLTFAEGETSKTISVSLKNDTDSEGSDTFTITLQNPTNGATLGTRKTVTVTILDNDSSGGTASSSQSQASVGAQGALTLGAAAYAIDENAGELSVTVERTGGTTGQVSVNYATSNNTALAGTNYEATSGTLTFDAGQTAKTFVVNIVDNTEQKGNKIFNLTLSNPTGGAVLGMTSNAQVSVVDDEAITTGTGSIKFSDATIDGIEGELLLVPVLRFGGTKGDVSVNFTTNNAGAQAGFDYQSTSGTLTFRNGESKKLIPVKILEDSNVSESNESFTITLSSPTNGAPLVSPSMTTISIFE
ncbi:MAG: Calx-beta domain-containing protein [Candidatus Peribacteraceae bacterium]|nr:Calx-beta domain-containing protein [Candidatus Peribacteraceae bacterium]